MGTRFYITTPLYYVNAEPHLGHTYTTILADVLSRYHRLFGDTVFFLTGTDEHGQKVDQASKKRGLDPQQHCDEMASRFQKLWEKLGVEYDDFIRTTEHRHQNVVQAILADLYERGEIYKASYDGWYCVPCERFWTEKDLVDGQCPDCRRKVNRVKESNYFFRMSTYQEWLIDYIEKNPEFIQPDARRNEIRGFLRNPLNDLCISRPKDRLRWGIELPFDQNYVSYVWFDALINYISAPGYLADEKRFQRLWPARYHLIGKDILTTHAVYWPTMLRAIGLPMPRTIFAHGWWLVEEEKMSKSRGNVVRPLELVDKYGVDQFRYFLMREMTLGQDANFSEEALVNRLNSDLANDLGNLVSRLLRMIQSFCRGTIPQPGSPQKIDEDLRLLAVETAETVRRLVEELKLHVALEETLQLIRAINRYIEVNAPWKLSGEGRKERVDTTLYTASEALRIATFLLSPVMPERCQRIRLSLGLQELGSKEQRASLFRQNTGWGLLSPGTPVGEVNALFPRQSFDLADASDKASFISHEDFAKVDLRVGTIKVAEPVPGTRKLLKLTVTLGDEERSVVAGIAEHYRPEELAGRAIVMVANLKPVTIRGVESRGMLLAATSGKKLALVVPDGEMDAGAVVS